MEANLHSPTVAGDDAQKGRGEPYYDGFVPDDAEDQDEHLLRLQEQHQLQEYQNQQPYHRVVAAPPGRLGITFVEYKGHAMVSDVLPPDQSPLAGWVFPGDILVAVDEVPVTGMAVREVIQVLRDRGNRQRALRVISSHEMAECDELTSLDRLRHHPSSDTSALMSDVS
jgi:C-terminal processing protease CtpA/Prc